MSISSVITNLRYLHHYLVSAYSLLHPVFFIVSLILRFLSGSRINGLSCSSQLAQFQDFLLRANKYNCLKMVGDGGATDKKLILVEVCTIVSTKTTVPVNTTIFHSYSFQ